MRLTADRLIVVEDERIHAIAIVGAARVAIDVAGGVDHLRHTLEDVGFHDVVIHTTRPPLWPSAHATPATPDLTWPIWLEVTPSRSASLWRDLTETLSITDAWEAEAPELAPLMSAYAWQPGAPRRLAGFVVVFGVAYPLFVAGVA